MIKDEYSNIILDEEDLVSYLLKHKDFNFKYAYVDNIKFNHLKLKAYKFLDDKTMQSMYLLPDKYKNFDIIEYVLSLCKTEEELQRVADELIKFQDRNMIDLLRYMKYLVDIMRENNIVWGVGRGSSVASYVLYLIGIHKINSIYYDLDIDEFLK